MLGCTHVVRVMRAGTFVLVCVILQFATASVYMENDNDSEAYSPLAPTATATAAPTPAPTPSTVAPTAIPTAASACGQPYVSTVDNGLAQVDYRTLYFNTQSRIQAGYEQVQNIVPQTLMGGELDFKLILTKSADQTQANNQGYCLYTIDNDFGQDNFDVTCTPGLNLRKQNLRSLAVLYNDTSKEMHIMPKGFNGTSTSINVSTHLAQLTPVSGSQDNTYEVTSGSHTWCYTGSRILHENGAPTNSSSLFFTTAFAGNPDILKKTLLSYQPPSNESLWWDIYLTRYETHYVTSVYQARQYEFYFEPVTPGDAYEPWPTGNVTPKPFLSSNNLIGLNVSRMGGWGYFKEIRFMVYSKDNQTHPDFSILVADGTVNKVIPLNGTSSLFFDTFGALNATDFVWNQTRPTPTATPTLAPTTPTVAPTAAPTATPTATPSATPPPPPPPPTATPTAAPTATPTATPSATPPPPPPPPTATPTAAPTTASNNRTYVLVLILCTVISGTICLGVVLYCNVKQARKVRYKSLPNKPAEIDFHTTAETPLSSFYSLISTFATDIAKHK